MTWIICSSFLFRLNISTCFLGLSELILLLFAILAAVLPSLNHHSATITLLSFAEILFGVTTEYFSGVYKHPGFARNGG